MARRITGGVVEVPDSVALRKFIILNERIAALKQRQSTFNIDELREYIVECSKKPHKSPKKKKKPALLY